MSKIASTIQASSNSKGILHKQMVLVGVLGALALLAMLLPIQDARIPFRHYLPLHTALEFLAIMAAFLVFATVWHTPEKQSSTSLLFIAVALLAAGWLDFAHALSYKGMPDFITPSSIEKGIAFWLIARFLVALTLFGVSFYPSIALPSRFMRYGVLAAYTVVNFTVLGVVFFYEFYLPTTFIEGAGLTELKVSVEWIITGLLVLAAWRYFRQARGSEDEFPAFIFGAAAIAALGETFFMGYAEVNDAQNLMGHVYKIVSYGLIYQAMFVISIRKPYDRLAAETQLLVRANETLRTQALALESTTALVFVTDAQGHFRWRNRASYRLLGGSHQDDLEGLSLFAAPVTPDPVVAAAIRNAVTVSGRWNGVVEMEDGAGNRVIMNRTVTSVRSEAGVLEGFVSVAENVTENRRARDRHKRVLDTAIDGFLIVGVQGNFLEVNAAFTRMLGYKLEELQSMNVRQTALASGLVKVQSHMNETARVGRDQFDTHFQHKQGHEISVAVSMTFDPEVQQFFVFLRDITDQVRSAAVQLDLERQLQQAQKMEALGQLTGGIAHDFNNILVSVLGYSKLALDRLVPDKQSKLASYLREVILASERARDLIAKMQVFTRTQSSATAGLISPAAMVQEVLAMMRPSIPSSIQLDVKLEDDLNIVMDPGELNQILINLIINARDAIDGQGVIGIWLHRIEANGQLCAVSQQRLSGPYLALEVTDTGSGITPEHMLRLFDPFFTTKDVGKGTGLGLSMVQGILLRSGGHIVVKSQPGRGSLFQLLFPIASAGALLPGAQAAAQELRRGSGQHIGVVDDEPAVTRYLSELLEGQGYRVTQFNNPTDALAAFESGNQDFNLVITDQTMPGVSGTELALRLHRVQPDLPVILCTGNERDVDQVEALHARIRHHFTKPVSANDLLKALAEDLDSNGA
jgi:PAS domain S-box-containing protein